MANLFTSQTPSSNNNSDGTPTIVVATTMTFAVAGTVTAIRWYCSANTGGTWTAYAWQPTASDSSPAGTLLTSQVAATPTGGTWNTVTLSTPISVSPGVAYRFGIHNDQGRYVATSAFFGSALVNGQITGIADGATVNGLTLSNGTFNIGAAAAYPASSFGSAAYFVDVDFTPGSGPAFPPAPPARWRWRGLPNPSRRRIATPVQAPLNPPFPFTGVKQPREIRGLFPRRARSASAVPAQVVVAAPNFPPRQVRTRIKGLRMFRGRSAAPVPAQVIVTPPAYPPLNVRSKLRGLRLFRPRAATPVPAQVVVTPPAYPPLSVRSRVRGLRLFRSRAATPVPVAQAGAALAARPRPHAPAPRRGHSIGPVPPQIAVAPPAYVPRLTRLRQRIGLLFRGGSSTPVAAGAAPVASYTSPNPELQTTTSARDLTTVTRSLDLTTVTDDRDLEA